MTENHEIFTLWGSIDYILLIQRMELTLRDQIPVQDWISIHESWFFNFNNNTGSNNRIQGFKIPILSVKMSKKPILNRKMLKSLKIQDEIREYRGDFYLKINSRTCMAIRSCRVLAHVLKKSYISFKRISLLAGKGCELSKMKWYLLVI